MELKPKSMYALAARDFKQVWVLVVTYCAIVAAAFVPAYFGDGRLQDRMSGLFIAPGILALLAVVPFVQTIVGKEKAAGTFLFLRMLPLTDGEILGSKLLVVTIASSMILLLPMVALVGTLFWEGGNLPPLSGWIWLWEWLILVIMVGWSTAATIAYTQQRAAVVPYMLLALAGSPFIIGTYLVGPEFWNSFIRWHAQEWGLIAGAALIWHGWSLCLRLFRTRDFAQLVE